MDRMTRGGNPVDTNQIGALSLMKPFYPIKHDPTKKLEPRMVFGISTPTYDPWDAIKVNL